MFGFLKKRRELRDAQTKIGIDLHRQILDALKRDNHGVTERLNSSFTTGYIYTFVRSSFICLGVDSEKEINSRIRDICNGVIPKKLYETFSNQATALELALKMKDQNKIILDTGLTPADVTEGFNLGAQAGAYDAPLVSIQSMPPDNLRRFLLKETLKLE